MNLIIKREEIIATARKYLGVPFHHQGRTASGLDCIGLIVLVAQDLGIPTDLDQRDYPRRPDGRLLRLLRSACPEVESPAPGAILLFRIRNPDPQEPDHAAILTEGNTLIQSWGPAGAGKVVEVPFSPKMAGRLVCCFDFPGAEEWR